MLEAAVIDRLLGCDPLPGSWNSKRLPRVRHGKDMKLMLCTTGEATKADA